jgi:hypothetical protein
LIQYFKGKRPKAKSREIENRSKNKIKWVQEASGFEVRILN